MILIHKGSKLEELIICTRTDDNIANRRRNFEFDNTWRERLV